VSDCQPRRCLRRNKGDSRTAELLSLFPGAYQPRSYTLSDALAFEFCDRSQDVELQPPRRCRSINPLVQGDEADTDGRQLVEQQD